MFIIRLTYIKPLEQIERSLADHREFLKAMYDEGQFLASGPLVPRTGGIIIAITPSKERLLELLADDPFWQLGIAEYDVVEFIPTMAAEEIKALVAL